MDRERPRKDVILSLLNQTFAARREEIVSDGSDITVTSIVSVHKALTFPMLYVIVRTCSRNLCVWHSNGMCILYMDISL